MSTTQTGHGSAPQASNHTSYLALDYNAPHRQSAGERRHRTANRVLTTIALVLSIVVLLAVIVLGIKALSTALAVRDAINDVGTTEYVPDYETGTPDYDFGEN